MNIRCTSLTLLAVAAAGPISLSASAQTPAYHLLRTFSVSGDGGWDYLNADGAHHRLFITRGSHVEVVDTQTGALIGDIAATDGVHGVALAPKSGFASCGRSNSVAVFDLKTLKVKANVPVGQRPDAILYDPASQRVFTFNGGSNDTTAIDAATHKVAGTIALGGRPEFAAADGMGHLYVNIEDKSQIVALDSKTLKVLHTWPLAPGESPSGLAIDAKHRRLFSVCDNQKMIVMDADTGKVVAAPAIGNGPDACAFDPKTNTVFSPNGEDGTLTVLHEDTPNKYTVRATVQTRPGARTLALDSTTQNLFLVTAKLAPAANAKAPAQPWRRSYAPGTFVVLEYTP